jgi:hypothetical protein
MYNLFLFINIDTCVDHNFGHHQALNEHSQVIKHIGYSTVFEADKAKFTSIYFLFSF